MDRREFARQLGTTAAAGAVFGVGNAIGQEPARPAQDHDAGMMALVSGLADDAAGRERIHPQKPRHIAMLIYPGMFALDLVGPHSVLGGLMNTTVHIVAKDLSPVKAGLTFVPTTTLAQCPEGLDVLFVPGGGAGTAAMMKDRAVLEFLRHHGKTAKWVASVCTGSLVLGAAGLLKGYRATTHWVAHELLASFGAKPVESRVVEDRNRITAAGVSAGIDFGLALAARMTTEPYAKALQLNIEYDPAPPFAAGSPAGAGDKITGLMRSMYQPIVEAFRSAAKA